MKPFTYSKFIKDNALQKDKIDKDVPKDALLVPRDELPIGVNSSLANTDGNGWDEYAVVVNKVVSIFRCKKIHGQWFTWPRPALRRKKK